MMKQFTIKKFNFIFVFENILNKKGLISRINPKYSLGIWYKRNKIVSNTKFNTPDEWSNNLINSYMIGIDLIIFKTWINFDYNGKHFNTN